jgi:hypothetical protein
MVKLDEIVVIRKTFGDDFWPKFSILEKKIANWRYFASKRNAELQ